MRRFCDNAAPLLLDYPVSQRRRPLKLHQRLARRILEAMFRVLFVVRHTLRVDSVPQLASPCVVAVFHDEMVATVQTLGRFGMASLASRNHNGYAVAQVISDAGFDMVYGSPTKGGKDAVYELLGKIREGRSVVVTVDGSRGPRHEMKPGAVMLALKAGVPLYLMRFETVGPRLPFSWDRFQVPLPFARVAVRVEQFELTGNEAGKRPSIKALTEQAGAALRAL